MQAGRTKTFVEEPPLVRDMNRSYKRPPMTLPSINGLGLLRCLDYPGPQLQIA